MIESQHDLPQALEQACIALYQLHNTYTTHDWGTNHTKGITYRQQGEQEWESVQLLFGEISHQERDHPYQLRLSTLDGIVIGMQGFRIRLAQHYASSRTKDARLIEEDRQASTLWKSINSISQELCHRCITSLLSPLLNFLDSVIELIDALLTLPDIHSTGGDLSYRRAQLYERKCQIQANPVNELDCNFLAYVQRFIINWGIDWIRTYPILYQSAYKKYKQRAEEMKPLLELQLVSSMREKL